MTTGTLRAALLALALLGGAACRTQPYTDDAGTNPLADLSGNRDLAGKPVDLAGTKADLAHSCAPVCNRCSSGICCGMLCCQPGEWCGPDGNCHCGDGAGCGSNLICSAGGPVGGNACGTICCGGPSNPCPL